MISDHSNRSSALSFGSDRLLHDLLHYTKILLKDRRIKRKILFVGDTAQLPPIGDDVSPALSEKYFFDNYRVECKKFNLNEVVRQNQNNPILHNAEKIRNNFSSLVMIGFVSILFVHLLVNMGMTVGLFPVTGLPAPFISYGGSFLLKCILMIGLINNITNNEI